MSAIELLDCTNVLLREIKDSQFKRKHIAKTYALALRSSWPTDWRKVNQAIVDRWSNYALEYIVKLANSGKCFQDNFEPYTDDNQYDYE